MANRTVTVFSDRGQDIVALALHRSSTTQEQQVLLADIIKASVYRISSGGLDTNGHNLAAIVIALMVLAQHNSDPELVRPDHDTLAALGYPTFRVDVDGDVIITTLEDPYGTEVFAGTPEELKLFCNRSGHMKCPTCGEAPRVDRVFPPIPVRSHDYAVACRECDDQIYRGYGSTEEEALSDWDSWVLRLREELDDA